MPKFKVTLRTYYVHQQEIEVEAHNDSQALVEASDVAVKLNHPDFAYSHRDYISVEDEYGGVWNL